MPDRKDGAPSIWRRWSRVSLRAQGVGALVFPMAVLFVAIFAIYWAETDLRITELTVAQAYDARSAVMRLQTSLVDAQAAAGAFLEHPDNRRRALCVAAVSRVRAGLAAVPPVVATTPATESALREFPGLGERLLALSDDLLANGPGMNAATLAARRRDSQDLIAGLQSRLIVIGAEQDRLFADARYQGDLARQQPLSQQTGNSRNADRRPELWQPRAGPRPTRPAPVRRPPRRAPYGGCRGAPETRWPRPAHPPGRPGAASRRSGRHRLAQPSVR